MDKIAAFQVTLWQYFDQHGRDLPWRTPEIDCTFDAYKILVSEMMLQQTQVSRVIPKYVDFLRRFPSLNSLSSAQLGDVLVMWSGLGYNRRAKYLYEAAQKLSQDSSSSKWSMQELEACKGIGRNTAAAVCVYAFNQPLLFIETNIRTVYIHHFFSDQDKVSDTEILPLLEATLDQDNPREFYWALMDYGSYLKKQHPGMTRRSKHYTPQSPLDGSRRQIRGRVLRLLTRGSRTRAELEKEIADDRLPSVLDSLIEEAMIRQNHDIFSLH